MPASTITLGILFFVAALMYSSVGHAGASGYLAAMALMGVDPAVMKPTSLALNIIVSSITSVQFFRAGHFRWRMFWPFAVTSIPFAFVGGRVPLSGEWYKGLVGLVLLFSAWRLLAAAPRVEDGEVRPPRLPIALGVGAGLGLLSGLTGTGGGIFLSPLILLCGWADAKKTGAVSAVFILVNSVAGISGLISKAGTLPPAVPMWAASVVVGGLIGSYFGARRLQTRTLRRLLAVVLLIAGGKLVVEPLKSLLGL